VHKKKSSAPNAQTTLNLTVDVGSQFNLKVTDTVSGDLLLSTLNQSFIMMTHFQELGFRVKATRFFGLGERNGNFLLKPGNYTLLGSVDADFNYDLGYGERQGYGQHPLLIM
jgi:hypothetical protein